MPRLRFGNAKPVSVEQLSSCASQFPAWRPQDPLRPIVATYATAVPRTPWLLGLAAAAHGLPLVVAGLGAPGFSWFHGSAQRPVGIRRAAQVLAALAPHSAVVWADSGDTIIANPTLEGDARAAMRDLLNAREPTVLLGAECKSWPKCYTRLYERDAAFGACLASGSAACFPNGGLVAGGTAAVLDHFEALSGLVLSWDALPYPSKRIGNVDRGDDQAALHHHYSNRSLSSPSLRMRLDSDGSLFVNLYPCRGPNHTKFMGPFASCYHKAHAPLARLSVDESGKTTTYDDAGTTAHTSESGGAGAARRRPAGRRRPFLLHSNGDHKLLLDAKLEPLHRLYNTTSPPPEWLRHPVLLIDSSLRGEPARTRGEAGGEAGGGGGLQSGLCTLTSLGALLEAGKAHGKKAGTERASRRQGGAGPGGRRASVSAGGGGGGGDG